MGFLNKGINGTTIKFIAVITMVIDHIGAILVLPYINGITDLAEFNRVYIVYRTLRYIGRIAFPLYAFLVVEGFLHTRNVKKYAITMLIAAFVTEPVFDWAFRKSFWNTSYQNVMFTLFFGILTLVAIQYIESKRTDLVGMALKLAVVLASCGITYLLKTDYKAIGIIIIVVFYELRFQRDTAMATNWILLTIHHEMEVAAVAALLPIHFYNGQRGKGLKYFFYAIYPAHIFVLCLIRYFVFGIF